MPVVSHPRNWALSEPDDAAAILTPVVEAMDRQSGWRHAMAARGAYLYERRGYGDVFGSAAMHDCRARVDQVGRETWGYGKSIIDTIVAKVAGLDNPKTQMVTTDAPYEERKDGVWADRFVEGVAHQPQGNMANLWDLGRNAVTLASASTGLAGIRTEPDFLSMGVSHRLCSTLATFIDPHDIWNGRPMTYVDVTWESPEILAMDPRWGEHEKHILASAEDPPPWMNRDDEPAFGTKLVRVITAWRLPFGKFKGREARIVGGKAIQWDEYPHDHPRISFFRADPVLGGGFWGMNLIERIAGPLRSMDKVVTRTDEALDLTSHLTMAVDKRALASGALLNAKNVKILNYDSQQGQPPQVLSVPIVDPSRMDFAERSIRAAHELLGVDQMHSAGRRPEGVSSGRAVRMVASLFSERHSLFQRSWRNFIAVDVAKNVISAAVEIGEHDPDWMVTWPGADFDKTVSVERVQRIQDRKWSLRPYAVSEQKNRPEDRGEQANEMLESGQITPEAHAIITSTTWDPTAELKGSTGQRRFFAHLIDLALHAEEEDVRDDQFWAEEYKSPPAWTDIPAALSQLYSAYWDALVDDVPQFRRDILKRTLRELDQMLTTVNNQNAVNESLRVNVDAPSLDAALGGAPAPLEMGAPNDIEATGPGPV